MQAAELSQKSPAWKVIQATATGSSHLSSGIPCQDAAGCRLLPSGLLAVALADGAGSALQAETGANLAVDTALDSLENSPANHSPDDANAWNAAILQAFNTAREMLFKEADTTGTGAHDYATTLLCMVAASNGLVFGQVGDGALIVRTVPGDVQILARPQRGEYANETVFLTMPDALEHATFQCIELDITGLALMSDGLIRLALQLPEYSPYAPFFNPLWEFAAKAGSDSQANQELADFLASEKVCARTDDDKSLVIAVLAKDDFQAGAANPTQANTGTEN